jgi:hypothetical protein
MNKLNIKEVISKSLDKLYLNDSLLLNPKYDLNERSVSHKLAEYLNQVIKEKKHEYDVDIEYNRMAVNYDNKLIDFGNIVSKSINYEMHPDKERYVYPDIVIHKRNENINICIFEIKMSWKNNLKQLDYDKIDAYMEQLNYKYGAYIEIYPKKKDTKIEFWPFKK